MSISWACSHFVVLSVEWALFYTIQFYCFSEFFCCNYCVQSNVFILHQPFAFTSIVRPKKTLEPAALAKENQTHQIVEVGNDWKIREWHKIVNVSQMYGKPPSTVSSTVAKKKAIDANVAKGVTVLMKQRSQTIEDVDQVLLIWINHNHLGDDSVS